MYPECIDCRGTKALCGHTPCPLLAEVRGRLPEVAPRRVDAIAGATPPSMFVGRFGYPKVGVGPSAALEGVAAERLADPARLHGLPLEEVAALHAGLVGGRRVTPVDSATRPGRVLEMTQEVAQAASTVDVELSFSKPLALGGAPTFDGLQQPLGPRADLARAEITEHVRVPAPVARAVDDTDASARTALDELAGAGIGEAQVSRLLSAGLLGRGDRRRLVPTRWSITASDDQLGRRLWRQVNAHAPIGRVEVRWASYLDNHFHIILTPDAWAFQLLEAWRKGSLWSSSMGNIVGDAEDLRPRQRYVEHTAGAYHAARLAVLEHLADRRRRGAALVWRDIGPGYWAPVGVWLIRETVRQAMAGPARTFESLQDAIAFVKGRISDPLSLERSWFVTRGRQPRLDEWVEDVEPDATADASTWPNNPAAAPPVAGDAAAPQAASSSLVRSLPLAGEPATPRRPSLGARQLGLDDQRWSV